MPIPGPEEIEAARPPAGGWTREQPAAWGVPPPPPEGWEDRLLAGLPVQGGPVPGQERPEPLL